MNKARRLQLHEILCGILQTRQVYFQPPSSHLMEYPCIRYTLEGDSHRNADDLKYQRFDRYTVTYIDPDPESDVPEALGSLSMCTLDRAYAADGLNHYVYTLYY